MYKSLIPDVYYENLVSGNTYSNSVSSLSCLKDRAVASYKKSHMLHHSTIVHDWLPQKEVSGFIDLAHTFPLSCLYWKMCFPSGFARPSSLLTLAMSSLPLLKWKMYFFKAQNEFFPQPNFSVPWNEFSTANLILPSNTSTKQHRPDSISHWSRWSITCVDPRSHAIQVMHSLYCHQACGNRHKWLRPFEVYLKEYYLRSKSCPVLKKSIHFYCTQGER